MSSEQLRIALAQLNTFVGDFTGNAHRMAKAAITARDEFEADIILFPELALSGYPPEDLLLRDSLQQRIDDALAILTKIKGITLVFGLPSRETGELFNQARAYRDGKELCRYNKQQLPNYQVFDEKRYFSTGNEAGLFTQNGLRLGLSICEDIWFAAPAAQARAAGADLLLSLNASPFHVDKAPLREAEVAKRTAETGLPVLYVNQVGGQDELVFDGGSFAMNATGEIALRADYFQEGLYLADFQDGQWQLAGCEPLPEALPSVYQALVLGVRDYVEKNGFKGVLLGLSGGIDSALTLAVAVDALGAERVSAVMMPFHYTAKISQDDAAEQAQRMGVDYQSLSIAPMYNAFMDTLKDNFSGTQVDTTEENLQSRCRGVLLMALSNKKGYLVLTTGNKSEMAVGYATLYGDMAGGFDVLKDVPKSWVFELARYRNQIDYVIPQRVIDRPPSAELAPDQQDTDSLPPYEILDEILARYIEQDQSAETIIAAGFERDEVYRVLRLVDINEYKRRQAAIGVRITARGFGRDRRYPVTHGWRPGI